MREIAGDINAIANGNLEAGTRTKVLCLPHFLMSVMSLALPMMKEIHEMRSIWKADYTVDDSDFCKTFGVEATPYKEALRDYVEFYQSSQQMK
jgi:hypothetical protein